MTTSMTEPEPEPEPESASIQKTLLDFFEYRKKYSPSTFHKTTKTIYQKLVVNKPQLKEGLSEIKEDKSVQA